MIIYMESNTKRFHRTGSLKAARSHHTQFNQHQENRYLIFLFKRKKESTLQTLFSNPWTRSVLGSLCQTRLSKGSPAWPTFWWLCALGQIQCVIVFVILPILFPCEGTKKRLDQCPITQEPGFWRTRLLALTEMSLTGKYQYFSNEYLLMVNYFSDNTRSKDMSRSL